MGEKLIFLLYAILAILGILLVFNYSNFSFLIGAIAVFVVAIIADHIFRSARFSYPGSPKPPLIASLLFMGIFIIIGAIIGAVLKFLGFHLII